MIKKWNAVCSWLLTLLLMGHLLVMSYSMWTGWYAYGLCKMLARGTALAAGAHAALTLAIFFFVNGGTGPGRYGRQNLRVILQRASALVILALLHLHVKAFGFIVSGASLSGADKAFLLITELLFFGAVSLHLGMSFSRSLITMGLLSSDTAEKRADRAAWAISALLMAVSAAALVKFVVSWTGFGG